MKRKTKTIYNAGDKVVIGGLSPCFFQTSGVVNIESYLIMRVARVNGIAIDETNAFTEEEFLRKCEGYSIEELENIQQYFAKLFGCESYPNYVIIYPLPKKIIVVTSAVGDDIEIPLESICDIKKHFGASEVKIGVRVLSNYEITDVEIFITVEKEATK